MSSGTVTALLLQLSPQHFRSQLKRSRLAHRKVTELGEDWAAFLLSLTSPGARGLFSTNTVTKATAY